MARIRAAGLEQEDILREMTLMQDVSIEEIVSTGM